MTRVLSTATARDSISKMQSIINGGLVEQIAQLSTNGQTLSQPEVWDGTAAAQFRSTWEMTERALRDTRQHLEALRVEVDRINTNIIAVLITAFLGAAMWLVFNNLVNSAADTTCEQMSTIGSGSADCTTP